MSDDPRILVLQTKLLETKMHASERDALADDLEFAVAINGDTAPVMQCMKRMLISGVRRELLAQERAERHYAACPIASQIKKDANGVDVMPWVGAKQDGPSYIGFSMREGFKATGASAIIAAAVITIASLVVGVSWWQSSKVRAEVVQLLHAKGALDAEE